MSIKIMQNAWEYSQHQGTRLNILLSLSDHANDRGISWPSLIRLAERSRSIPRNVRRHLRALEDTGEIYSIPRDGTTSFYLVTIGFSANELTEILNDILHVPAKEIRNYVSAIVKKRGYSTGIPDGNPPQIASDLQGSDIPEPVEGGTPESGVGRTPESGGRGLQSPPNHQLTIN